MKKLVANLLHTILKFKNEGIKNGVFRSAEANTRQGCLSVVLCPKTAATYVLADGGTSDLDKKFIAKADPTTGRFTLNGLPAGTYNLSFITADATVFSVTNKVTVLSNATALADVFLAF